MKIASYTTFYKDLRTGGLEYALQHSAALGFDAIEVIHAKRGDPPSPSQVREARARFDAYGMPIVCYSAVADLSAGAREQTEMLKRHAEHAATLGAPFLHHTLLPSFPLAKGAPAYGEVLPRVLDAAAEVAEYAASLGVCCLYEPQGLYFNGIEGLESFFTEIRKRCPAVGICADAGNPLFLHTDPVVLARHFAPFVRHAHVKNYAFSNKEPATSERYLLSEGEWLGSASLPGGIVSIPEFLSALPAHIDCVSLETTGTDEELCAWIAYLKGAACRQ